MIVKEFERVKANNKFEQAGYNAESQMAFYLKREFKDDSQFLVFNNLRFEKDGDACQIDHLVLHRYGMVIIESKSVTTRVEVNELGEWKRWFNNTEKGMPSPILQAQRQGKFLKNYLEDHVETLLDKLILGRQAHFNEMPIDLLVAVSDSGIINRPKNDQLNTIFKADQIADKVKGIVSEYRKIESLLIFSLKSAYLFNMDEVSRISNFILVHHKPSKDKVWLNNMNSKSIISYPIDSPIKNPSIAKPIVIVPPQKKIIPSVQSNL